MANMLKPEASDDKSSDELGNYTAVNPYGHDNKTIIAMMVGGDSECRQAIFSSADVLGITNKHKIEVFYYGRPHDEMYEMCRNSYSYLKKREPERYGWTVKYESRMSTAGGGMFNSGKRSVIIAHLREHRPKFVVLGLREGMSPELLDNSKDIAFRQCLGSTPIICKKQFIFKQLRQKGDSEKKYRYDSLVYAFRVDWSEDAFHAFKLMIDHFRDGDFIHLIWIKPDAPPGGGGGGGGGGGKESLNIIFSRYLEEMVKIDAKVEFKTHISGEPNVGQFLVNFANDKRNAVDFLVVYCDLMGAYAKGQDLIGSVADWAIKFCRCPVIVPKLPAF